MIGFLNQALAMNILKAPVSSPDQQEMGPVQDSPQVRLDSDQPAGTKSRACLHAAIKVNLRWEQENPGRITGSKSEIFSMSRISFRQEYKCL